MARRRNLLIALIAVICALLTAGVLKVADRPDGQLALVTDGSVVPPSNAAVVASEAGATPSLTGASSPSPSPSASPSASSRGPADAPERADRTRAKAPPRRTSTPTTRARSVKKGAAVWKADGITGALADSGVSWMYGWAAGPNGVKAPSGVEFVPMIWGADSTDDATLRAARKNGTVMLGFNEPDLAQQSNLSVERALDLWPRLEATGRRLGSPAVAWGADRDGGWLDRFMAGARQRDLRVDFITLHWYGSDLDPARATDQLRSYVAATHAKYGKPIWVTEYALMNFGSGPKVPSPQVQAAFVKSSTAMLERLPYVERYAWFAFPTSTDGTDGTGLYRPGGAVTQPGRAYRAAGRAF